MTTATATLCERMALAYAEAGIFALEAWAEAVKSAEHYGPGERRNKALARSVALQAEADRCERIVAALGGHVSTADDSHRCEQARDRGRGHVRAERDRRPPPDPVRADDAPRAGERFAASSAAAVAAGGPAGRLRRLRRAGRSQWRPGAMPVVQRVGVEMNYPVYTAEHKRRAAELRADGLTYPAIACAMGITHVTTVQRWLTGGVQPRGVRADTYVSGRVCVECGSPRHRTARGDSVRQLPKARDAASKRDRRSGCLAGVGRQNAASHPRRGMGIGRTSSDTDDAGPHVWVVERGAQSSGP
jgi:hypothetical protein